MSLTRRVERLEQTAEVQDIFPLRWWNEGEPKPTDAGMIIRWMRDGEDEPGVTG